MSERARDQADHHPTRSQDRAGVAFAGLTKQISQSTPKEYHILWGRKREMHSTEKMKIFYGIVASLLLATISSSERLCVARLNTSGSSSRRTSKISRMSAMESP